MITAVIITLVLMRFGLLSLVAVFRVSYWTHELPVTTRLSAWYGVSTILVLIIISGLAAISFYLALGGQKVFAAKLLED